MNSQHTLQMQQAGAEEASSHQYIEEKEKRDETCVYAKIFLQLYTKHDLRTIMVEGKLVNL